MAGGGGRGVRRETRARLTGPHQEVKTRLFKESELIGPKWFQFELLSASGWNDRAVIIIDEADHERMAAIHDETPALLGLDTETHRQYWWYQEYFYVSDPPLESGADALALILDAERKQGRRVDRAKAALALPVDDLDTVSPPREMIPDDVRSSSGGATEGRACVAAAPSTLSSITSFPS